MSRIAEINVAFVSTWNYNLNYNSYHITARRAARVREKKKAAYESGANNYKIIIQHALRCDAYATAGKTYEAYELRVRFSNVKTKFQREHANNDNIVRSA